MVDRQRDPDPAPAEGRYDRSLLRAISVLILFSGTSALANEDPSPPRPGLQLTFSDEFDGPRLSPVWSTSYPWGRWLKDEVQIYLDPIDRRPAADRVLPDPFQFKNGVLAITAERVSEPFLEKAQGQPFASGLITTRDGFQFTYGYVEMRAKLPEGRGLWPAFWMFRPVSEPYGEIDILETLGHEPHIAYSTIHFGSSHSRRRIGQTETHFPPTLSAGFHVFAVDWTAEEIRFFVNGLETGRFPTPPELKEPMFLLANLALGGPWGKPPDETTPFPARLEIDYIRVWQEKTVRQQTDP